MDKRRPGASGSVLVDLDGLLPDLEAIYTDLHARPELSMQEQRTAGVAAERLRAARCEVTAGIGKTGVVSVLRNGEGPTVMLRADRDPLPVKEATGLPHASTVAAAHHGGRPYPGCTPAVMVCMWPGSSARPPCRPAWRR